MIVLKETGFYLRRKANLNFVAMTVCLVILIIFSMTNVPGLPIAVSWGGFTNWYALAFALLGLGVVRFYRSYKYSKQGFEGENRVTDYLKEQFQDTNDCYLVNDITYVNDRGYKENIDHIFLSSSGIFAIETKDFRGKITCKGSFWTVPFPYGRSPSKQAAGNAFWLKKFIDSTGVLLDLNLFVKPIIVFSNPKVELETINPEVEAVKLDQLEQSIKSFQNGYNFSNEQLKKIGLMIKKIAMPID